MPSPVARIGDTFEGRCSACDGHHVTGTLETGEFVTIEGRNICVTGSIGRGSCGHTCIVQGQSAVWSIEGKQVARVGDPVTGTITGTITSGCDFVETD